MDGEIEFVRLADLAGAPVPCLMFWLPLRGMLKMKRVGVALLVCGVVSSTPALAGSALGSAGKDPDAVKCKSHVITGTLAKMERECHTRAQWEQIAQSERNGARDFLNGFNNPHRSDLDPN